MQFSLIFSGDFQSSFFLKILLLGLLDELICNRYGSAIVLMRIFSKIWALLVHFLSMKTSRMFKHHGDEYTSYQQTSHSVCAMEKNQYTKAEKRKTITLWRKQTFGVDIIDSVSELDTILPYDDYHNSIYFQVNLISTYQIGLQTVPETNINIFF